MDRRHVLRLLAVCYSLSTVHLYAADTTLQIQEAPSVHTKKKARYTFIVYMAADNDLRRFAARNIKQMAAIGSMVKVLNIVVHLDIRLAGNKKITRRYYIEKDRVLHVNAYDPETQMMDSGLPETLISCCKWAIENYPADNYALILWNHGTGIIDPTHGRVISPTELFVYNPAINMLELDRSVSILRTTEEMPPEDDPTFNALALLDNGQEFLSTATDEWQEDLLKTDDPRGVCWDDSVGNYLTNQKLDYALQTVRDNFLNGDKLSIIGFDACLMSMLEVANLIAKHADYMVGSQEVELGTGWNYQKALDIFTRSTPPTPQQFAQHIAHVYKDSYATITNDYTQSALDLAAVQEVEQHLDTVASLLVRALSIDQNKSVLNAIRASKNKLLCTHFDEPSYIDLCHFLINLEQNLKHFACRDRNMCQHIVHDLKKAIAATKNAIAQAVLANVAGTSLQQAHGISIYFPEQRIHSSYVKTDFYHQNNWARLLEAYVTA
jgi:hypothetical protein